MANWFVDVNGGATGAGDGSSFANKAGLIQSVTGAAAGDTIRLMGSPNATSLAQSVSFTNKSKTLTLTTAVTANISTCESNWTASTNVTCTNAAGTSTTARKEGSDRQQIAVAGAFTTGLAAFFAFSSTDFSSYQQISFWVQTDTAIAASAIKVCLCSDNAGVTIVNTATVTRAININRWTKVTVDTGGALSASIQSVAFYVITDLGAGTVNVYLDNIIACKASSSADSLNLCSLIGKNGSGTGNDTAYYPIKSINGTTVIIDMDTNIVATTGLGYAGTTESVTAYKLETIKTASQSSQTGTVQNLAVSGSSSGQITVSGGWDITNMSTQNLNGTIFDSLDGNGYGLLINGHTNITVDKVGFTNYYDGIHIQGVSTGLILSNIPVGSGCVNNGITTTTGNSNNITFGNVILTCNSAGGLVFTGSGVSSVKHFIFNGNFVANSNTTYGINFSTVSCWMTGGSMTLRNNDTYGMRLNSSKPCQFYNLTAKDNGSYGVSLDLQTFLGEHKIFGYTSSGNTTASINIANCATGNLYLYNAVISDSTAFSSFVTGSDCRIYSQNDGGTVGTQVTYMDGGKITTETGTVHGSVTYGWQASPTSSSRDAYYPITTPIARLRVASDGNPVVFTAWVYRDNTAISHQIRLGAQRVTGCDDGSGNDLIASATGSASTWEQKTLTFTPTQAGVIEIYYDVWDGVGTTHSGYVSDLGWSQT